MAFEKDPNEVGAVWEKNGPKGVYLSISIDMEQLLSVTGGATDKVNLVAFPLSKRTKDSQPNYRVLVSNRASGAQSVASNVRPQAPRAQRDLQDDDIPF